MNTAFTTHYQGSNKMDKGMTQKRLLGIYGKSANNLSPQEVESSVNLMKSNKNWTDKDIKEMARNKKVFQVKRKDRKGKVLGVED
jgi:hypothetical protein